MKNSENGVRTCQICGTIFPAPYHAANCCSTHPHKKDPTLMTATHDTIRVPLTSDQWKQADNKGMEEALKRERRERIAAQVLAGMCANPNVELKKLIYSGSFILEITDALIMELDKT